MLERALSWKTRAEILAWAADETSEHTPPRMLDAINKHTEALSNIQSTIPCTTTSVHTLQLKKEVIITVSKRKLITHEQKPALSHQGCMAIFTSVFDVESISKACSMSSSFMRLVIKGLTLTVPDAIRFNAFLKWAGVVWNAPSTVVSP